MTVAVQFVQINASDFIVTSVYEPKTYSLETMSQFMGNDEMPDDFEFDAHAATFGPRISLGLNVDNHAAFLNSVQPGWYVNWNASPGTTEVNGEMLDNRIRQDFSEDKVAELRTRGQTRLENRFKEQMATVHSNMNLSTTALEVVDHLRQEYVEHLDGATDITALTAAAISANYRNGATLLDTGTQYQKDEIIRTYGEMNVALWNYWTACQARFLGAYRVNENTIKTSTEYETIYNASVAEPNALPAATVTAIDAFLTNANTLAELAAPPEAAP